MDVDLRAGHTFDLWGFGDTAAGPLGLNQSIQNAVLSRQLAETGVKQAQAQLYPVVGLTSNWNASQNVLGIVGDEIPDDLPPSFSGDLTISR